MIKADQDSLRDHNLSLLLETLLGQGRPLSRAELAKRTGLTKATVSLLIALLLRTGVLVELAPDSASVGRPSRPLGIAPRSLFGVGLQINTDGYGYSLVRLDGHTQASTWVGRDMEGIRPQEVFDDLSDLVMPEVAAARAQGMRMAGAAIGLPGLVEDGRFLLSAPNLGWGRCDLRRFPLIRDLDVIAANEANLAAISQIPGYSTPAVGDEAVEPAASFLYLSTDIGIGGAIVEDGHLRTGGRGFAGEFGHLSVDMDGPLCACGRHGCLEMYAGRRALVEAAGIAGHGASAQSVNARRLVAAWKAGDPAAREALDRGLRAMESALVSLINVTDIPTVVLGGFWANFDRGFAIDIERHLQRSVLAGPRQKVSVRLAGRGGHPALAGAARLGLHRFVAHPAALLAVMEAGQSSPAGIQPARTR